jgi:hypothetical protein
VIPFDAHLPGDPHIIYTTLNPLRDRGIMVLASSSAPPVAVVTGEGEAHLLRAWESDTPANFGGDGHAWWAAYYIVPKAPLLNLQASTGATRLLDWFMASADLPDNIGQYGDGVSVTVRQALAYSGSHFGFASEETRVTQHTRFGELMYLFTDIWPRSIDDVWNYFGFHHQDRSVFDHDDTRHNMTPQPNDFMLCDTKDEGEAPHEITMSNQTDSTASSFPGACRVLVTQLSVKLRGLCPVALIPRPPRHSPFPPMGPSKPPPMVPLGDETL